MLSSESPASSRFLGIDEDIEDREGFAFAAGAALAHQMRSRK